MSDPAEEVPLAQRYRPNVAAILEDGEGKILIGERADHDGCWQFPQGGVEPGDTPESALPRELQEELCLEPADYRVEQRLGPYRYLFPPGITKKGFGGQEQYYFRLRLLSAPERVDFENAVDREFQAVRWIRPEEFSLAWAPEMKREVYRQVFKDFFGIEIA
jgi:putative (di)nucleoside polyphosphate hydrolase